MNIFDLGNLDINVSDVNVIEYKERSRPFVCTTENRKTSGIVFVKHGSIMYHAKNDTFEINEGEILLLQKGETYQISNNTKKPDLPYGFFVISLTVENRNFPFINRVFKPLHYEKYLRLFEKSLDCMERTDLFYRLNVKMVIYELLYNIYRDYYSDEAVSNVRKDIEKVKMFIDSNYQHKITVDDMANISGYSRSHFKRLFSKYYGMSPSEYLTNVRINKAKSMLESNIFYLSEIAEKCGFSNEYYFSKVFKRIVGCSPKKY